MTIKTLLKEFQIPSDSMSPTLDKHRARKEALKEEKNASNEVKNASKEGKKSK